MKSSGETLLTSFSRLLRAVAPQLLILGALSAVLGICFNSANPIGIHWSTSQPATTATLTSQPSAPPVAPALAPATSTASPVTPANHPSPAPAISQTAALPQAAPSLPILSATSLKTNLFDVTWGEVKLLVAAGQAILVDVRGRATYDAGHIPGAVSLQEWSTPDEIRFFQQQYPTNKTLVVYCGNLACPASEEMREKLVHDYGYQNVLVMKGGYAEWQKAELGYDPTPTRTTWAETKPLLATGEAVLLDARPKASFEAGHIPGAVSLPEASPEDEFKSIQKKYPPDQHIVVYCSDLKCSASMRVAIKLVTWYNFRKVQFMPGGFQEWQQSELAQARSGI
jgi:rhodanese-related sulfurtransferase